MILKRNEKKSILKSRKKLIKIYVHVKKVFQLFFLTKKNAKETQFFNIEEEKRIDENEKSIK